MGLFRKILVLVTALIACVLLIAAVLYHILRIPEPVPIPVTGQPTIGNPSAKVEVVVFEDFLCRECRVFHETIFTQIEAAYIATKQIQYTFVPLSFLDYSKPLGNAALAVYHLSPEKFFPFAGAIFRRFSSEKIEGSEKAILLDIAREVGGIDGTTLERAIDTGRYYAELDRNFSWAGQIMGKELGTPALYVNGVATPTSSFRAVQRSIDRAIYLSRKK